MKLSNINKPTKPLWNKIALACTTISSGIAGYGYFNNMPNVMLVGGLIGILGNVIPIFASE